MIHAIRNDFTATFLPKFPRQIFSFLGIDIMPTRSFMDWMKLFRGSIVGKYYPSALKGVTIRADNVPPTLFRGTLRGLRVFSYKTTRTLSRGRSLVVNKKWICGKQSDD